MDKIGKYQVLGTLGAGANSTILHIRRSADAKHYALKVVPIKSADDAKFLKQAQFEYDIAKKFDHANLIRIHTLETERDWLFRIRKVHLLIEYVNGKTLDTFKRLDVPRLVQIFARVAAGLAHMHQRGVYHADLKPNNILLSRTGDVKIIDYGLAWTRGEERGRVQGTPEYMAPEQARKKIVNERTDIYNFGATMYRLVTWRHPPNPIGEPGSIPLDGKNWDAAVKPVRECCADAPPELCDVIHRCIVYNPKQRPESVNQVQKVLDRLEKSLIRSPADSLEALEW